MTERIPLGIKGMNINDAISQIFKDKTVERFKDKIELYNQNQKTAEQIINKFKPTIIPETIITIFEKSKNPQQPETQIDLTNFQISDSEISFLKSDNSKNRTSMKFVPFCIVTKLGIKNKNGLLEENLKIYPTSTKLDQTS